MIIQKYKKTSDFNKICYLRPTIHHQILLDSISQYGINLAPEDVIMLYAKSTIGMAGLFCTDKAIFVKDISGPPTDIPFSRIETITVKEDGVCINNCKYIKVHGPTSVAALVAFLLDVFHAVTENMEYEKIHPNTERDDPDNISLWGKYFLKTRT